MTAYQYLLTATTVLAMAAGQILFKLAALDMQAAETWLAKIVFNRYLALALFIYLSATALWVTLLRQVPLNLAYPFVALVYLFVPVLGHWFLHEPLRWQSLAGAAVIVLGVWISVGLE